jgi:hypothetical protein
MNNMKKIVVFAVVGLLCWAPAVWSQTKVQTEGTAFVSNDRVDIAREKALEDALRKAVEKVVGVMVTSRSEVENFELKMDQILSESRGFVNKYAVISENRQGDQFALTVEADVGRERLKDRLEALQLVMARKAKPRIMLLFNEKAQKDAIAEAAMSRYFLGKGFKLIDAQVIQKERGDETTPTGKSEGRQARPYGAEVVMIGAVEAESNTFNLSGIEMNSNKVTVSVKVVNGDTGEVVTTGSKGASAPGMRGDIRKIAEEAAEKLARQMMEEVLEKWSWELTNTVTVKLVVTGLDSYESLQQFKGLLASQIRGFKEVQQRSYSAEGAELDVEMRGNSRSLADDLALISLNQKKISILGITANRVDAGFKP